MTYAAHRPEGAKRGGDSQLARILQSLRRKLAQLQQGFAFDTLRLDDDGLDELAGVLVDFAEDLHNDIGLWQKYERAGKTRYDMVQRAPDGSLRVYYGVTEEGLHGEWEHFVEAEAE